MLKRINLLLTIIMGVSFGVFIGYGIYVYWHYRNYPGLYQINSAPWYTGILLYGAILLIVLAVCLVLKWIVRKRMKK